MLALLLLASCGVTFAGAAGVGTFSIEQTTVSVGVDQFGVATLYMDNTWDPSADGVTLHLGRDPAVIQYVSTDWRIGNSVLATLNSPGDLTLLFADWANKYPSGRVPVADVNFRGVTGGQTTLGIRIKSVRSHVGVSPTEFVELTASSLSNSGIFTVGQGGGTVVPTVPMGTTPTVAPTLTIEPNVTVTVVGVVTVTPPITIETTGIPITTVPTGITTDAPFVPPEGSTGGSEEYTGVVTRTATPTTTTATGTATVTPTATTDGGVVTVTMTTGPVGRTATLTAFGTTPGGTTTARTTAPVNTTATATGVDTLPLAVAGLAALALIAAWRR